MAARSRDELEPHLPLSPAALHILLVLAGGERHGYAIMREAEELSSGRVRLAPGTLYRSLRDLLEARLIEEREPKRKAAPDDERRRTYRLSGIGRRVLAAEMRRLEELVSIAGRRKLLRRES